MKTWTKNTQTSMVTYMDEKHRKTWIKNTQTSIIKYMEEKFTEKKKPTVREEIKFTNLTARCEPVTQHFPLGIKIT